MLTGSMVLSLIKYFLKFPDQPYIVYLDNYFTSISLFEILRDRDVNTYDIIKIGAARKDFPILIKELREDYSKVYSNTLFNRIF